MFLVYLTYTQFIYFFLNIRAFSWISQISQTGNLSRDLIQIFQFIFMQSKSLNCFIHFRYSNWEFIIMNNKNVHSLFFF